MSRVMPCGGKVAVAVLVIVDCVGGRVRCWVVPLFRLSGETTNCSTAVIDIVSVSLVGLRVVSEEVF